MDISYYCCLIELSVKVGAQDELAQDDIDAIFTATGNHSVCNNPFM